MEIELKITNPIMLELLLSGGLTVVPNGTPGITVLYIELTYAAAISAMSTGMLKAGTMYKITDCGDRGVYFTAISIAQFSAIGTRPMLFPATYAPGTDEHGNNWIGLWDATKEPAAGDLAVWGNAVWRNLTGSIGSENDYLLLNEPDWELVEKTGFVNGEYVEVILPTHWPQNLTT
jgi:hypothetical protein